MEIKNLVCKTTIVIMAIIFVFFGCSDPTMNSNWRSGLINIDGSNSDWSGSLKYFEDEKVAIGISNDNNFVYFCLATSDNSKIMKILRTGFTVWLDPQNSDGKTIGFQYPIKRETFVKMDRSQRGTKSGENNGENLKPLIEKFKTEQNEILIVNHDKFPLNAYPLENDTGLEVKINYEMHQMVYELKVPLGSNKLSSVYTDALPNEILKIGFESGEFERSEGGERGGMNMSGEPGDGRQGRGRGGMRRGRRPSKGNMQEMRNPIEFWMEVKLAAKK